MGAPSVGGAGGVGVGVENRPLVRAVQLALQRDRQADDGDKSAAQEKGQDQGQAHNHEQAAEG